MNPLYNQIVSLQQRINASLDDKSHQTARSLQQEAQRLEDDAQTGKNPISIEGRVKQLISLLERAGADGIMSPGDVNTLVDTSEHLRSELQKQS